MGYLHIENLYRPEAQRLLLFKELYALEKVHGTSAHIRWTDGQLGFHSGGEKQSRFEGLFDHEALRKAFQEMGHEKVVVYGEAYGGAQQKQAWRYGPELRFVAFDVMIGDHWLTVPSADEVVTKNLGLRFVDYAKVPAELSALDAERDRPSTEAKRNGVEGDQPREGVVLRPVIELTHATGRLIAKHKRDDERETKTPRKVVDPSQLETLTKAEEIAEEWVTPTRLEHVLDKLPPDIGPEKTRDVIAAMTEDVLREGSGEFVDSKEARAAIGRKAAKLFLNHLKMVLRT